MLPHGATRTSLSRVLAGTGGAAPMIGRFGIAHQVVAGFLPWAALLVFDARLACASPPLPCPPDSLLRPGPLAMTGAAAGRLDADDLSDVAARERERLGVSPALLPGQLPHTGRASLVVSDISGRTVARQALDLGPGPHAIQVSNEAALRPGVYLVRLEFAGAALTRRAVVVR